MIKRSFDLLFASLGLIALSPVFLIIWLTIKIDDQGPVIFRQIRIGLGGRPFTILKFRSMCINASSLGPSITGTRDPRVTRVGEWLRKTKLDELPQLWNVLRGDMTFVGPRPEVPRYVALYSESQCAVLALRPGITDEASIEFRNEEALLSAAESQERFYIDHCIPRKIAINLAYAKQASLCTDIGVIFRTIAALIRQRG